jgi:hypothetical protein
MKIECGKRKLSDGTIMYVDTRGRKIYFGGAECEPEYKIVFQPEKRGPAEDFEHKEFEKCLNWSNGQGFLTKHEMERRIRRGRPVTVLTNPIVPVEKKKITPATGDINVIIANITKLHAPYTEKAKDNSVQNKEDNEESSVKNEEDGEEICMQKEDAAYVGSVCDNVFRSSVIHAV